MLVVTAIRDVLRIQAVQIASSEIELDIEFQDSGSKVGGRCSATKKKVNLIHNKIKACLLSRGSPN
jgi:hypothetical protein